MTLTITFFKRRGKKATERPDIRTREEKEKQERKNKFLAWVYLSNTVLPLPCKTHVQAHPHMHAYTQFLFTTHPQT